MRSLAAALILAALISSQPSLAGELPHKRSRIEVRCALYAKDWEDTLKRYRDDGLSPAFIDGNYLFINGGCSGDDKICPSSEREWKVVDVLTILVVDQGMSSTFLPFSCHK